MFFGSYIGIFWEVMCGIFENILRYIKEINNKQIFVINEIDELVKEIWIIGILFIMEKILKNIYWIEMM